MPPRLKKILLSLLISLLAAPALRAGEPAAVPAPRPFRYATDTFAFANETVWNYIDGAVHADSPGAKKREYTRHCFVVTRAAVQFWKFARFDPDAKPISPGKLADRIRQVTARSVWLPALPDAQRIVFPGYASLREISAAQPGAFQANIGLGWPVYFRAGNMPIVVPMSSGTETQLNAEIFHDLQKNVPTIVWLYQFPSLKINHVVVIYAAHRDHGLYAYTVYDPNYSNGPKHLIFDSTARSFSYQPTFYFKGGPVTARAIYRGVLQ
jgi:hypothetical protein